jgi:glutamyl-tRNA synthetase
MKDTILKHALINATEHGGKAEIQAVLKKLIAEDPTVRNKVKEIMPKISKILSEVNKMTVEEQKRKLQEFGKLPEKKKVKESYELPDLPGAKEGKVITAFPPEPSKYPHLGHAKAALVNFLYARKYKGKFILRFEDSNPELAKKEYYKIITDGLKWLGIKWDKLDYLSDHLPEYYKATEELISKNIAYICTCKQEDIKRKREAQEVCIHRMQSVDENTRMWKNLSKMKEGEAVVRLKIDMKHPNTTMRDPAIMRVIDLPHPRTDNKYKIWPVYDFGTSLLDIWESVTHRVRSKEFELRKELQQFIQKSLGAKSPYIIEIGRFNIEGVPSSGRTIREMIETKQLSGWDDPRLTTLVALKRRGFVPEAITKFLLSTGVTKTEAILTWEPLEAENRKVIDLKANRYFAVLNPEEITIKNLPKIKSVEVPLHPENKKKTREISVTENVFIEKEDFEKYQNNEVGLINLGTVVLKKEAKYISNEIKFESQKIQWVPEKNTKIRIVMPDGSMKEGIAEINVKKLKVNQLIQLVRIGFCRVDKVDKDIVLYYSHK